MQSEIKVAPDATRLSGSAKPSGSVLRERALEARALACDVGRFAVAQGSTIARGLYAARLDMLVAVGLAAAAAVLAALMFSRLSYPMLANHYDTWFDADVNRVLAGAEGTWPEEHYRTKVHPLFALFVSLPLILLRKLGLGAEGAAATLVAVSAFALVAAFYGAARTLRLRRLDSVLATVLMLSTSASVFWLGIPETYVLGSATMLLSLVWLGAPRGSHDAWSAPLQSLLAASMTVTNWMAGLIAGVLGLGVRRGTLVAIFAFAAISALTIVQQALFPEAGRMFDFSEESAYFLANRGTLLPEAESTWERLLSFAGQPLLAPSPTVVAGYNGWPGVAFGSVVPTAPGASALVAAAGWVALLAVGAGMLLRVPQQLRLFLISLIALQVILHTIYGHTLFLYSLHFIPLVVLVAAMACASRWRRIALAVMAVTAIASFAHNVAQFGAAVDLLQDLDR